MQSDGSDAKDGFTATSEPAPVQVAGLVRRRFGFNFNLEVHQEQSSFAPSKNASNADFDPIPPSKRTWNWGAYVAYWMADAWAVSNWEVGKLALPSFGFRVAGRAQIPDVLAA
jgi:NCS1 family nucleobase:cation symporter-1